ncbi:MAG: hypothetical protein QOJ65_318 [Fimbriimonadaceae bacterium]|jgi:hypothetical protein|nr:hypothetical protein [Fimbriimonadaceae bacterium]
MLTGQQYLDTGWVGPGFTALLVFFVLFNIWRANAAGRKGRDIYIRRIPGLNAIDEAVGRATEMGRPVIMVPGLSDTVDAIVVQALNIFSYVSRIAARFSNPILVCCYNAATFTVAQEMIRDVYQQEGAIERYDQDSVRFISDRQFAFAAGVSGLILREQAAATFFLGAFYAESLILAETANSVGAIQVASSTEPTQTPFFIAACDYVLIGDEFYAASAYLTRQPVLVGSLVGQDWSKIAVMATVLFGAIMNSAQYRGMTSVDRNEGETVQLATPRKVEMKDTFMSRLFTPDPKKIEVTDRPQKPAPNPLGGGQ